MTLHQLSAPTFLADNSKHKLLHQITQAYRKVRSRPLAYMHIFIIHHIFDTYFGKMWDSSRYFTSVNAQRWALGIATLTKVPAHTGVFWNTFQ